jgi:DNA mismatch repair protein MutS
MNSANAIDCQRLSKTLLEVPAILGAVKQDAFAAYADTDPLSELCDILKDAFVDNPPVQTGEGGMFRDGYSQELDEARRIQNSGREFISQMEAREKEKTGIKTLKIGYNHVFGYYIEISKSAAQQVQPDWGYVRKQTLVSSERFISPELKEKEDQILHAEENAIRIEKQLFASDPGADPEGSCQAAAAGPCAGGAGLLRCPCRGIRKARLCAPGLHGGRPEYRAGQASDPG